MGAKASAFPKSKSTGRFVQKYEIDLNALRLAYEGGESMSACGHIFGVPPGTVRNYLLAMGARSRGRGSRPIIDDDILVRNFTAGKTPKECAVLVGVNVRNVNVRLRRLGIPPHSDRKLGPSPRAISKKELCQLYVDEQRNIDECAAILKVSQGTISTRLRKFGIKARPSIPIGIDSPYMDGVPKGDKSAYMRAWRKKKKEHLIAYQRAYKNANRDRIAEVVKIWGAKRRRSDLRYALRIRMTNMIGQTLRRRRSGKGGKSWRQLVPYTIDELKHHLQKTMPNGYTWDDFMSGRLHIDHKIPHSVFNYSSPADHDFTRCWALSNLQLLPAEINIKKGASLSKPFQPTLL